jgi:hypothetical protein
MASTQAADPFGTLPTLQSRYPSYNCPLGREVCNPNWKYANSARSWSGLSAATASTAPTAVSVQETASTLASTAWSHAKTAAIKEVKGHAGKSARTAVQGAVAYWLLGSETSRAETFDKVSNMWDAPHEPSDYDKIIGPVSQPVLHATFLCALSVSHLPPAQKKSTDSDIARR